jgi:diguanylate cyclase (GGDEF)-like protein/PAS domain S-box-containing protein
MSDGVLVIDVQNRMVDINPTARRLLEMDLNSRLIGQPMEKIYPDWHELEGYVQNLEPSQVVVHQGESYGRYLDLRITPLYGRNQLTGRLVVLRDITEQKMMESNLRENEEWFRTIFDESPIGILTADANGLITQVNNAYLEIIGASNQRDQIAGKVNLFVLESLKRAGIDKHIKSLYKEGTALSVENHITSTFEKQVFVKFGAVPVKDQNERVTGCIVNAEDIGVRKAVEEAELKARRVSEAMQAAGLAINSTLDFDRILNLILEEIGHVIHYDSASVALIQEDELVLVSCKGVDEMTAGAANAFGYRWPIAGPDQKVIEQRRPLIFQDIRGEYGQYFPPPYEYIQSILMIPLFSRDEIVGILNLDSKESNHFSPDDETMAAAFATQVSVALENSNLYSAAQRRIMEQSVLNEIIQSVSSKLELKEFLELVDKQLNRYMDIGFLLIASYEEETDTWQPVYLKEPNPEHNANLNHHYPSSEGMGSYVLTTRKPLLLNTTVEIDDFLRETGRQNLVSTPKSMMSTPLIVADKVVGFMSAQNYERANYFPEADFGLFCLIGSQIAVAFENAQLFEQIKQLAITDTLTGLYTRRHFFSLAETEVLRVGRYQKDLSLIMIDFDHFKRVNDTYGHLVGDQVLLTFGRRMREAMRPMDFAGRYGGEEFVVLLPETSIKNAQLVAERLRKIVASTEIVTPQGNVRVTISLGVAMINSQHATLESLLDHADQALYEAKQAGKNRVKTYSP